jgi:hypothetical protein
MKPELELTDKQAVVFDNLHNTLGVYSAREKKLSSLRNAYEDICKNTIIMDDEDAATVATYRRVLNDLRELYK